MSEVEGLVAAAQRKLREKVFNEYVSYTECVKLSDASAVLAECFESLQEIFVDFPVCEGCKYLSSAPMSSENGGCLIKTCMPREEWKEKFEKRVFGDKKQ